MTPATRSSARAALPGPGGPAGPPDRLPRVVAFGGGHGLAASLGALRLLPGELTAVVTVADDGGSSGRLRAELPALLPPGDLRMALCALAAQDEVSQQWAALLQHRFGVAERGDARVREVGGHAVGNLLLAGLLDTLGDPVTALDRVAALVNAAGRVLPLAAEPLTVEADVALPTGEVRLVRGQVAVASTSGVVRAVRLLPSDPRVSPATLDAIAGADAVVLGPGSLFTSQLPHLLVPAVAAALRERAAPTAYLLNLVPQPGETDGFSPGAHLAVLHAHAPWLRIDVVVADDSRHETGEDAGSAGGALERDQLEGTELERTAERLGARVVRAALRAGIGGVDEAGGAAGATAPVRHDPARLAEVLAPWLSAAATRHGRVPQLTMGREGHRDLGGSPAWR